MKKLCIEKKFIMYNGYEGPPLSFFKILLSVFRTIDLLFKNGKENFKKEKENFFLLS